VQVNGRTTEENKITKERMNTKKKKKKEIKGEGAGKGEH